MCSQILERNRKVQTVILNSDSLRLYLKQISKILPLSPEEVHGHAKQVQQMRHLLELKANLRAGLDHEPTFAEWGMKAGLSEMVLKTALQQGRRAKRKLIEANLRLVVVIARRYQNQGVELLDLIQEGSIGLNEAVDKFDPTRGYKFSTYAYWWIRREISRYVTHKVKRVSAPVGPEQEQCIEAISLKCIEAISLNSAVILGESTEILDLLKSEVPLPEEIVAKLQRTELVKYMVEQLPDRQKSVLMLLYGLKDGKPRSLTQAGAELGLSRDQVRWAQSTALEALRAGSPQASALIS